MPIKRRDIIWLGGAFALIYGARTAFQNRNALKTEPISELPPFERLIGDYTASLPSLPLLGIEQDRYTTGRRQRANAIRTRIESALFPGREAKGNTVPIAYFTAFNCPYCRLMERRLASISEGVSIFTHELPIFGLSSELAARASLAAEKQGGRAILRKALSALPLLHTPESIANIAPKHGLKAKQLLRDMEHPNVQAQLDDSRALADIFGFIGTPSFVIGQIAFSGAVSPETLRHIIEKMRIN